MTSAVLYDDRELLKQIAAGSARAFELIYHRYSKKIYLFALKTLRAEAAAEEVLQEVMLKIWKMGPALTEIENLEQYLRTSARNNALNLLRRQEIESRANEKMGRTWSEENNDTEEQVILNDTRRILDRALAQLPPQQREVYRLCHQQGLKYEEAAKQLNLAPSTVATHMKLALKFLREQLKKHSDLAILLIVFKLF